jgi:hypothetical protein
MRCGGSRETRPLMRDTLLDEYLVSVVKASHFWTATNWILLIFLRRTEIHPGAKVPEILFFIQLQHL